MDIRIIALDLDGTLLNSQKQLSYRNRQALVSCIQKGIHVVPATGRTILGIPKEILDISGIQYAVTVNGAVVLDINQNKVISSTVFPKENILKLLDYVAQFPLMYDVYIGGRGKSEDRFMNNLERFGIKSHIKELVKYTRDIVPSIRDYIVNCNEPVEKMNLFFGDMQLREQVREGLKEFPFVAVTSSMDINLELNDLKANKGNGLIQLAEFLGFVPEQIMAFGDGENDYEMLLMAGQGIAMDNGVESLKEKAKYVTACNDKDGVARAIEKFIL